MYSKTLHTISATINNYYTNFVCRHAGKFSTHTGSASKVTLDYLWTCNQQGVFVAGIPFTAIDAT